MLWAAIVRRRPGRSYCEMNVHHMSRHSPELVERATADRTADIEQRIRYIMICPLKKTGELLCCSLESEHIFDNQYSS